MDWVFIAFVREPELSHGPPFASEPGELAALDAAGTWADAVSAVEEISDALRQVLSDAQADATSGRVTVTYLAGLRHEVESLEQEAA